MTEEELIAQEVLGFGGASRKAVVAGIDDPPDSAARAFQLSDATGVPAPIVYGDLEGFERNTKMQLASSLVENNPHLSDYIATQPLAAQLSNDDYAQLDTVSQSLGKLEGPSPSAEAFNKFREGLLKGPLIGSVTNIPGRAKAAWEGAKAGFDAEGMLQEHGKFINYIDHPAWRQAVYTTIGPPVAAFDVSLRLMNAVVFGLAGYAGEVSREMGLSDAESKRLTRDVIQAIQVNTSGASFTGSGFAAKLPQLAVDVTRVQELVRTVEPYALEGREPPVGLHPIIDQMKIEESKNALSALDDSLRDAMQSATRERNPDIFANFIRLKTDAKIGISPEAIEKLYGDKLPEPGDGKLGWVSDLTDQIAIARESGADVQIPLADWLAKVEQEIAKELHDDIRVRPNGLTTNEAKLIQEVDARPGEPIEGIRTAAALEPSFAVGDRKLSLQRFGKPVAGFENFHDFEITDQNGKPVGVLNLSEQRDGKSVYIESIEGLAGYGPRDFGPGLIRDLLRQVKALFPNAEAIEGYRVSGARDAAGAVETHGKTKISFAEPDIREAQRVFKELTGGSWEPVGPKLEAYLRPRNVYTEIESALVKEVDDLIAKIVPRAEGLDAQALRSSQDGRPILGAHIQFADRKPIIAWALEDPEATGTVRHEAVHHLRKEGFLTPEEWSILESAAKSEGWVEKYGIDRRYSSLKDEAKLEEAIAEGYKYWERAPEGVSEGLRAIFQKLKDLFEAIRAKVKELLGKEPTWEELFEKIDSGEIGAREGAKPITKGAFSEARGPKQPELGQALTRMEDRDPFAKAAGLGMTEQQYARYLKLIEKRHEEDLAKAEARAEKEHRRRLAPEWKEREIAVRQEVVENFAQRPDIAVDEFFRNSELFGDKLTVRPKLNPEFLTEEQIAALPKEILSERGMHPDDIAGLFGYESGRRLVDAYATLTSERKASGLQPAVFRRKQIDAEVDRQMELRYGRMQDQVLEAAKEQALSETQQMLLHEETLTLATQAKAEFAIEPGVLKEQVHETFQRSLAADQTSDKYLQAAGKAGRATEDALLKGDYAEAFHQKQRQYLAFLYAREAKDLETAKVGFDKLAKRFAPRESPKGVDQEYTNYIQALLRQAHVPGKLGIDEIQGNIDHAGYGSLEGFVEHNRQTLGYAPEVADWLMDGRLAQYGGVDKLKVSEFYDLKAALDSLNFIGREVKKINLAGEKADFAAFKAEVIANLAERPERSRASQREGRGNWFYKIDAELLRPEELIKDLDLREELGPLFKAVIVPLMQSKAKSYDMLTELSSHFKAMGKQFDSKWRKSLDEVIPQTFVYDAYEGRPMEMTRQSLLQVMLNWGTRSNIEKFTRAYATIEGRMNGSLKMNEVAPKEMVAAFEAKTKALIDANARAEDWQWVQKMWEPFKGWKPQIETVSRNMTGIAPKWIPETKVATPFGEFDGGYWPVRYDRLGSGIEVTKDKPISEALLGPTYFQVTTPKGYLKARTGLVDYVDIRTSVEQATGVMQQTIHDIAYRDSVVQAGRIFRDKEIRAAIRKYYGTEYEKQLMPWLRRIANQNPFDNALEGYEQALQWMRINLVGHTLPLNLRVILSPDVGVPNPKQWAAFQANRAENVKLAMEKSDEIRHMVYNMDRDFREMLERSMQGSGYQHLQAEAVQWAFKPSMLLSQQFRMMTFVDQYQKALAKGHSEFEASQIADSYVRERHGAASVVDLPAIMQKNEWVKMATLFYGYFNTMYNWQRQLPGQVRSRDWSGAAVTALGAIAVGAAFNAAVFQQSKKDEGWGGYMARALLSQPLGTIPGVREVSNWMLEGHNPRTPQESIMSAIGSLYSDIMRKRDGKEMKNPIRNTANVVGLTTGLPLAQIGRTGEFMWDVKTGAQRPKNFWDWYRGIIHGTMEAKK